MRASEHPARHPPGVAPRQPFKSENPEPEYLDDAEVEAAGRANIVEGGRPWTEGDTLDAPIEPQPTRELIATAPKDGRDVRVFWSDDDEVGRLARWKDGRYFNGRRWLPGGRWVPTDEMTPLTMDSPTHWLKPVDYEGSQAEDEPAAA